MDEKMRRMQEAMGKHSPEVARKAAAMLPPQMRRAAGTAMKAAHPAPKTIADIADRAKRKDQRKRDPGY